MSASSFSKSTDGFLVPVQFQTLELWRHALVASVRGDSPDLSARQMALLLCVYLGEGPHTVRGMAQSLRISKPAVSRALDRLGELKYIRRQRDDLDRRNVLVQRTEEGGRFLADFADMIERAKAHVETLPPRPVDFTTESVTSALLQQQETPQPETWSNVEAA